MQPNNKIEGRDNQIPVEDPLKMQINKDSQQQQQNFDEPEQQQQQVSGKFFNLADVKPLDLKSQWLGQTDSLLQKYVSQQKSLQSQKDVLKENLRIFAQNENKYRISSLRKVTMYFDKKEIYQEFIRKSRKQIEKLHPSLIMNIMSYADANLFLIMARMRRVSKVFDYIYKNEQIRYYIGFKDLGINRRRGASDNQQQPEEKQMLQQYKKQRKNSSHITYLKPVPDNEKLLFPPNAIEAYCKRYISFVKTVKYYKQIFYTQQIPHNSVMKDLQQTVNFINDIHKIVYLLRTRQIHYFQMVNKIIKDNRLVIGLSTLSLTSLVLVRKASIIAFSNYLAFNRNERKKQQITKTKYIKVIEVVEDQDYRDSLIVNTKISNYMEENFGVFMAIFIAPYDKELFERLFYCKKWDILLFHIHDQAKSKYYPKVQFALYYQTKKQQKFQEQYPQINYHKKLELTTIEAVFTDLNMNQCSVSVMSGKQWYVLEMRGGAQVLLKNQSDFKACYLFRGGQYYFLMMVNDDEKF